MKCSLTISTYNRPDALCLCLLSIRHQTVLPDEVIVADDGSTHETAELIKRFAKNFPIPLLHVWQPDEGFQLAKIRNKAFAKVAYPYIIQIDGDLILHRQFVKDHLFLAKCKKFVTGSRVLLQLDVTQKLLQRQSLDVGLYTQNGKHFFNCLRIPFLQPLLAPFYKSSGVNKYYVKGCNMAFWKEDLLKVNGYNEEFTGWGSEDKELAVRLINAGVRKQSLKMGGVCYHLYHREASHERLDQNVELMNKTIAAKTIWAPSGMDRYLSHVC